MFRASQIACVESGETMRESLITKICRYKRSHSSSPQTERGKRVLIQFRNINAFLSSDIIAAGELEIKHTRMGGGVLSYSLFINLWWALNPLVTVLHFYKQCLYFVVERWHHEIIRNLFLRFLHPIILIHFEFLPFGYFRLRLHFSGKYWLCHKVTI